MRGIREFIREEDGVGVVELILILVVLIGLVLIFKDQPTSLVNDIFSIRSRKRRERSENEKESKYYGIFRTCVCAGGILPYGSSGGGKGVPDTDVCRYEVHACAGVGMRRVSADALGRISSAGTGWRLRWGYIFHGSCNRCFKRAA